LGLGGELYAEQEEDVGRKLGNEVPGESEGAADWDSGSVRPEKPDDEAD